MYIYVYITIKNFILCIIYYIHKIINIKYNVKNQSIIFYKNIIRCN